MPRKILIAGNWKMNHGPKACSEFIDWAQQNWAAKLSATTRALVDQNRIMAALYVPAVTLQTALRSKGSLKLTIGAQNAHWEKSGAFTGELSGPLLKEIGISSCLVGHSERRQYFGETDETVRKRTESLAEQEIEVILCVGETRQERENNLTETVLERQLRAVITSPTSIAARHLGGKIVVAYEPVWAIGTGLTATPEQAQAAHRFIRQWLTQNVNPETAEKTLILYGGSVTPENIAALLGQADVDGGLVGGASLKPESFLAMIENAGQASQAR